MTSDDEPGLPGIGSELRAERLGFALRSIAVELVDERRKVAQLRREVADLRARLASLEPQPCDQAASRATGSEPGASDAGTSPTEGRQPEGPQSSSPRVCPPEGASRGRHVWPLSARRMFRRTYVLGNALSLRRERPAWPITSSVS
jgi:septal ring factor EnvC (AmiA/AmiB activator)